MAAASSNEATRDGIDQVDRWFRALDQRLIYLGVREWLVQVTGVYVDNDDVWVQIADGSRGGGSAGGSIVLRVSSTTSIEQAVRLLTARQLRAACVYPMVVSAVASPIGEPQQVPATN